MSTADRDYDEKRDFIRMRMNANARVHIEGDGEPLVGECQDLSAAGMSLTLDRPLEAGTAIRVVIASPNDQLPALDAQAVVIRCDRDGERYRHGVEIRQLA